MRITRKYRIVNIMRALIKKFVKGVAWQNPYVNFILKFIDPVDFAVRKLNGNPDLPRYSVRVRSNGFNGQFGGRRFAENGLILKNLLVENAGVTESSDILEVGCGCGRTAIALSKFLTNGSYIGMDIEKKSLHACLECRALDLQNFQFDFLDVKNDEYNPEGVHAAKDYRFPYDDESFDTIFLVSVFTHMLTDDVKNYLKEYARMLRPGGTVFITTFLTDFGVENEGITFNYKSQDHHYQVKEMPEVAVGYESSFYDGILNGHGLVSKCAPIIGAWRTPSKLNYIGTFSQDIVVYEKPPA